MASRLRDRVSPWVRRDNGMTLVEVIVTVALIALVVAPLTVVMASGLNTSSHNASRQNAAVLATSVISKLSAASYPTVGFTAAALGSASSSYGATNTSGNYYWTSPVSGSVQLVVPAITLTPVSFSLGSTNVSFAPQMAITTTGTRFTVSTYIYWDSASDAACPGYSSSTTSVSQAYKHVYVKVTWHNGSLPGELTQDSVIYPGGQNPYRGPSYNSTDASSANQNGIPATPLSVKATATSVSGEVTVSWALPLSGWSSSPASSMTSCFAVGWSNSSNVGFSSGLLAASSLSISGSKASYTVSGLQQGGVNQTYTFYVTAYAPNGVDSTESADSPTANAPQGPVITAVSDTTTSGPDGVSGDTVTLTGTGFSTGSTLVRICPVGQACSTSFSSSNLSCASTTSCTWKIPTPPSGSNSAIFDIVAETPTGSSGAEITSPPNSAAEFTYVPTITPVSPSTQAAGSDVTITGAYLYPSTTFWFGVPNGSSSLTGTVVSCPSSGVLSSCIVQVPSGGSSGASAPVYAVNGAYQSNSEPFSYQ